MDKNKLLINFRTYFLILACIFFIPAKAQTFKEQMTDQLTEDFFKALDDTIKNIPFSKEKLETLYHTHLLIDENSEYTLFYLGRKGRFSKGINLNEIDLRLSKIKKNHLGFLVLRLEGECISIEALKNKFPSLQITSHPRGRSLEEKTYHSVMQPWGKLSFGFAEHTPGCLASIIFDPNAKTLFD